jgi:hypothetical protein
VNPALIIVLAFSIVSTTFFVFVLVAAVRELWRLRSGSHVPIPLKSSMVRAQLKAAPKLKLQSDVGRRLKYQKWTA